MGSCLRCTNTELLLWSESTSCLGKTFPVCFVTDSQVQAIHAPTSLYPLEWHPFNKVLPISKANNLNEITAQLFDS
jgi:hypothetical protein